MSTIEELLSTKRLNKYGLTCSLEKIRYHTYNIELSETFYPLLIHFEIVLRNKVDFVFSSLFGDNWILDSSFLNSKSFDYVQKAQKDLHNNGKDSNDKHCIISELTFGFWTSLFMDQYKSRVWDRYPTALSDIFNKAKTPKLKEKRATLNHIRNYRNKVFHANSIIHPKQKINPQKMHNLIITNLKALDAQSILTVIKSIDRFDIVYKKGIQLNIIEIKQD